MVQRANNARAKVGVAGHARGFDLARHPRGHALAQQSKVLAVQLGRVGLGQWRGVHGADQGVAVVLVQPRPRCVRRGGQPGASGNAVPGLTLTTQGAGQHRVQAQGVAVAPTQVFAQPHALALAERAELVIVVGAKAGLAVAHEVKGSHGGDCGARTPWGALRR